MAIEKNKIEQFRIDRVKKLKNLYSDEPSARRRYDQNVSQGVTSYNSAAEVRTALKNAVSNRNSIVEASKQLYATNPVYASIIDYMSNMYM